MMELTHHTAPITSLSVDPLNRYLLSTSLEGKLCIWDIHLKKLEASFNITKNVKVIRSTDVSIARWSNTGKYIATNATGNEIIILRRNQKNVHAKLLEHSKPVTNLDWSNRDPYLASVSADKVLMIWNVETKSILFQYTFAFTPLHVRWQPYFPHLVVTFNRQSLAVVQLPYFHDPPKDALHQLMDEPLPQPIQSEKDDSELDDRMDESASDLDDFIVDDEGEGPSRKEKKEILNAQLRQAGFVETTPMQPSFQPGATPVSSEKYYLAFNMHGLIYAVQQDIATSYHIERHDRSRHKPIQFTDVRDFTFASLSHVAAVFACPPEKDLLGSLYVRILDPYSTQSDWTVMLAADEPPLGVAAGDNVVLVTDTLVRIYSVGGMPLHMISMSGIYVSVVAQAQLCVILTHSAAPFQDRQQLSFSVMDLHSAHSLHEGRVPLPPHAVVSWLGLSDTGLPLILDSLGTLRGYSWELEHWCPLLSTKKLETDASLHYFGVGLVDTQFLCLVSKTKYPGFPRPALSEYPCEFLVQQPLEKQYLRLRFFKPNAIKSYEKCILQLIQMACQNELHQKALDLVGLLTTPMSFSKATQIALFYHLHTLAEKIQKIGEQKQAEPILEHEPPSVPPPSIHSSVPPSNFTPQLPLNESTPLFPESHPSNAHVESSKRLPTFEPINSNKKPRLNPFLKKNFNPFRETPPTVSIHHSKVEVPLKQGSLSNFITHPNKDMQGE
ncbi:hypothetical protein HMI55_007138 [Coelomomyces lativittatus]|nr:hypothetical protein HMI55_007138 [Coelomomyces lativittatus]